MIVEKTDGGVKTEVIGHSLSQVRVLLYILWCKICCSFYFMAHSHVYARTAILVVYLYV